MSHFVPHIMCINQICFFLFICKVANIELNSFGIQNKKFFGQVNFTLAKYFMEVEFLDNKT